jgi:hypothetical protein
MTRLLIPVLAATTHAFKTPKSRALKVRGGIDIQKLGTALIGLEGIVGMIAPCNFFAQMRVAAMAHDGRTSAAFSIDGRRRDGLCSERDRKNADHSTALRSV